MPTAPHPPSGPEVGAAGCVHPAPRPSGPRLGSASGGPRRKPGWEAGEGSSPVPSALPAGMRLDPNLFLYLRPHLPAGGVPFLQPPASPGPRVHSPPAPSRPEERAAPPLLALEPSPAPAASSADPALILPSPSHASPSREPRSRAGGPARSCLPCSASARERWGGGAKFPKLRAVLVFHTRPALPAPGEQATQRRGL